MTENNDKLLIDFFAENRQEIPDNGFTRRVMRHLPDRTIAKYVHWLKRFGNRKW